MELALGFLGWSSQEFWKATPMEFGAAISGKQEALGIKEKAEPLSQEEFEFLSKKFPDKSNGGRDVVLAMIQKRKRNGRDNN